MATRTRSFLDERREALAASGAPFNGIAGIEVDAANPTQLVVRFVKPLPGQPGGVPAAVLGPDDISISGGDRIRAIDVTTVAASDNELAVTLNREGDFSPYVLSIDDDVPGFDPILRRIEFRFRAQCDTDLDCEADAPDAGEPRLEPRLDYLARDYESYRSMIIDRLAVTTPDLKERNPASLEMTVVEWMAYLGDQLSYRLDQVATEYSLDTARLRASAARHARLVGYRMHNGISARVLAQVTVAVDAALSADDLAFVTRTGALASDVVAPDELGRAVAAGALVFQPAHDMALATAHNRIGVHHWGDADTVLPKGATSAWLRDPERDITLRAGDILVLVEERDPTTGRAADADPMHRQAIRLVADPEVALDPLELDGNGLLLQVLKITWGPEDALRFDLCVGQRPEETGELAAAYGNIVVADHGMSLPAPEPLGVAPSLVDPELPPAPGLADELKALEQLDRPMPFAPVLNRKDLTFTAGPFTPLDPDMPAARIIDIDPSQARAAITLSVAGSVQPWTPVPDLLGAGPEARVFVPEVAQDGTTTLRFGQGHEGAPSTQGKTPVAGDAFLAHYRVGTGDVGNIGADALAHVVASPAAIASVTGVRNWLPAAGGQDRETIVEARQRAPVSFREQRRAVTLKDYEDILNAHPDVQRAHARKRWLGAWSAIFLSVDRIGSLEVDEVFRDALLNYLEPFRMMGHDLTIDAPIHVPLSLALKACVKPDYFAEDVEAALKDRFSAGLTGSGAKAFFHPDNITFSSTIFLSRIYEEALQVDGVEDVIVTGFQRAAASNSQAIDDGFLTFGAREIPVLSNDPNRPDAGTLTIETEGGR